MRCFVAVELPPNALAAASAARPSGDGVRPASEGGLHLTLHFLGDVDVDAVCAALARHPPVAFELALSGVGAFEAGADRAVWAGVAPHEPVRALHASVAAALAPTNFVVEARPYEPHVTLGRGAAGPWEAAFLASRAGLVTEPEPVRGFALWSSGKDFRYEVVRRFG